MCFFSKYCLYFFLFVVQQPYLKLSFIIILLKMKHHFFIISYDCFFTFCLNQWVVCIWNDIISLLFYCRLDSPLVCGCFLVFSAILFLGSCFFDLVALLSFLVHLYQDVYHHPNQIYYNDQCNGVLCLQTAFSYSFSILTHLISHIIFQKCTSF